MLNRENRLVRAEDFRLVSRRGKRRSCELFSVALVRTDSVPRFGFVVSKKVGNSVVRHRVARVLRHAAREFVSEGFHGWDVVVYVRPAAADATVPVVIPALKRMIGWQTFRK